MYRIYEVMPDGSLRKTNKTVNKPNVFEVFKAYGFGDTYLGSYVINNNQDFTESVINYGYGVDPVWKLLKE